MHANETIPPEQRTPATICHLSTLGNYLIPGVGFIVGPLIAWLVLRDKGPAVDRAGRETLNFALSITLWTVVGIIATVVLALLTFGIGLLLLAPVWGCILVSAGLIHIIIVVMACIRASDGQPFNYPFTIQFL